MSTRANLIKCRGLITHENELSVEEGSLRKADNVNMYFTTDEGIKRISLKDNSTLVSGGTVSIAQSGVPKAASLEGEAVTSVGGFLPKESKVGYRFIFGKKDANSNLLLGAPSARTIVTNTNADVIDYENFVIGVTSLVAISNGDYVVIPTLNGKFTFYFDTDGTATEPYDNNTFGSFFVKVDIAGASSESNVAAILANSISTNSVQYTVSLTAAEVTLTSLEDGNIDDAIYLGTGVSEVSRSQGLVTLGDEANVSITTYIPAAITTDYFVQVYRTAFIQATDGLTLSDLDPGDESNLVFEYGLEDADITAGEYTFTDSTPESFRASSAPLYTNEISGSGILQSNDLPPIALDIELFRGSMFFANTKSSHRLEFTIYQ